MKQQYDVILIGAGPASCAMASLLCDSSYSVLILEKSIFPRFSIGESLLPQCMVYLEQCGLLDAIPADLFQEKKGAVFKQGKKKAYIDFSFKSAAGPEKTWQVERSVFDQLLLDKVVEKGAKVLFSSEVISVDLDSDDVSVKYQKDNTEQTITCRFLIDGSGSAMVLPHLQNTVSKPAVGKLSIFNHFEDDLRVTAEDDDCILVGLHPENNQIWYWGIPLKNNKISVGVVADEAILNAYPGSYCEKLKQLIDEKPSFSKRLVQAKTSFESKTILGYTANVSKIHGDKFLVIGNAGGFIDPVFSSGITLALKSACEGFPIVEQALQGKRPDWTEYDEEMNVGLNTFQHFVDAWYAGTLQDIIFSEYKEENITKHIISILAGYAWDQTNPFVKEPARKLKIVKQLLEATK